MKDNDAEDRKKIRERKERIQHPHMIKSRSHWDWDMGYDDKYPDNHKHKDTPSDAEKN